MVWSACVIAPTDDTAAALATNVKQVILRRVQLPCPYRVQMLFRGRFRGQPYWTNPAACSEFALPPIAVSAPSRAATMVCSADSDASADVSFVERIRESHRTRLSIAIREFEKSQADRLAAEQFALRQQFMRASERKPTEKSNNLRARGRASATQETKGEPEDADFEQMSQYLDSYEDMMGGDSGAAGYTSIYRLDSAQRRIKRLRWADQRARTQMFWSDSMNRWITVTERGDGQSHAFWSFVHSKKVFGWVPDPTRGRESTAASHCSRDHEAHEHDHPHHHCKMCDARWGYFLSFTKKMKERIRLMRQGRMSKEDIRRAQIQEARQMRDHLSQIAEAERVRKQVEARARRIFKSPPLKRHENTLVSAQMGRKQQQITAAVTPKTAEKEEVAAWNESSDEELVELAREKETNDDDINNRPELQFQDKMYGSVPTEEIPPANPPPVTPLDAEEEQTLELFDEEETTEEEEVEDEQPPTPPPPEPIKEPTPPPPAASPRKDRKVSFHLPKPKPIKREPTKLIPLPPASPSPVPEKPPPVRKPRLPPPPKKMPKKKPPPPPPPEPMTPTEPLPPEPEPEPPAEPESPSIPLPMKSFSKRKEQIILEEATEETPKRIRNRSQVQTSAEEEEEDDYDFIVVEEDEAPSPGLIEEPAKSKLQRPANWGAVITALAEELSFRPTKSAAKRRALDRAIAERQKAARGRKTKMASQPGDEPAPGEEEASPEPLDLAWIDQFYFIQEPTLLSRCRYAFQTSDTQNRGKLDIDQTLRTLCRVNPSLSDSETFYIERVMELFGLEVYQGIDFRLFTVMSAFSLRLTALDEWVRTMINEIDFRLLEFKIEYCKRLWITCSDDLKFMSEDQFRIMLLAGGITPDHELSACTKLFAKRPEPHRLDFLDFLSYLPLFIAIHLSISFNPMDNSRTK